MEFQRRAFPRWLILVPVGVLVLIGGGVVLARGRPRLTGQFPAPGAAALPGLAPVRISFSRPMNRASVVQNLAFLPSLPGDFSWQENVLTFTPSQPWPAGGTVSVTLGRGARASIGLPLAEAQAWSFSIAPTMLAYLWPADGPANLFMLDPLSGDTLQLTTMGGLLDFTVSEDGLSIFFSAQNSSGGADLWRLDMLTRTSENLLACGQELCSAPQPSPQGTWLAYENTTQARIGLLPLTGGAPSPAGDGVRPLWSPAGLLAFYDPGKAGYLFLRPGSSEGEIFTNETGEPGAWSTDGRTFVAPEILPPSGDQSAPASHLFGFIPINGIITDLTGQESVEDSSPSFSPDGARLAFARKFLDTERWTPGRQLWVMNTSGGDERQVTDAPLYNHSAFAWHPDGNQIAYVRSNQATLNEPPEIWVVALDSGTPLRLVIDGFFPGWVP